MPYLSRPPKPSSLPSAPTTIANMQEPGTLGSIWQLGQQYSLEVVRPHRLCSLPTLPPKLHLQRLNELREFRHTSLHNSTCVALCEIVFQPPRFELHPWFSGGARRALALHGNCDDLRRPSQALRAGP